MRKFFFLLIFFIGLNNLRGQVKVDITVKDSSKQTYLEAVTIVHTQSSMAKATDNRGRAVFSVSGAAIHSFTLSSVGFESKTIYLPAGRSDTAIEILLAAAEHSMEEVIVSSSRTNSRMEDLPTKVEVLGSEELTEENGIKPGNIASLLGDIAGIQIQQTSAATGNADMRIQGVPGKYTQLLRDGMPLFGGYGGSFSILQIPPLDLQQIELIKGATSTLYGGGAIAGMVNLISKKPLKGLPVSTLTLNRSTLKENNLNAFFSGRNDKAGYTLYAGGNLLQAVDVNKDGFSDVPSVKSFFIHPRLFLYSGANTSTVIGSTINYEDRNGGDMAVLQHHEDSLHRFFIRNKSLRNTVDIIHEKKLNQNNFLTLKGSSSLIDRKTTTNAPGLSASQFSWYTEAAYSDRHEHITWVGGINWNGESFHKKQADSSSLLNYNNYTLGAFAQADVRAGKLMVQPGIRADYVTYDKYRKALLLPRLSVMYKFNSKVTSRINGGLGYKIPTPFTAEVDERSYHYLLPVTANSPERSYGLNADVNFKTTSSGWRITLNQGFFLTHINHPLVLVENAAPINSYYINEAAPIVSSGIESYIQLQKDELELYAGYTYTNALRKYNAINRTLPLTARHKFATVIAYEFSKRIRAGIESAFTGPQHLDNGRTTPSYLFAAAMVRYNVGKVSFVLNAENLLDYRQSKKEPIVFAPLTNPSFPEIWAPVEGRVINLSINIKLH